MDALYLGVDPGASGGLAFIRRRGKVLEYEAVRMPATRSEIWGWFADVLSRVPRVFPMHCCIEKVGGWVGEKDNTKDPAPGSAMFNFGMSYGALLMALDISCIPYIEVHSTTWQAALGLRGKGGKLGHKKWMKEKAKYLFPRICVTLHTADALLLAHYCRLQQEGLLAL
jgi:hypothetical protein